MPITVRIINFLRGGGAALIWASSIDARSSPLSVQMQPVQAGGETVSGMPQTQRALPMVTAVPTGVGAAGGN